MKGSAKGPYGLQFMVDLALQAGRGPSGGCKLAKHPSHITALKVLEALKGHLGSASLPLDATHDARAVRELWTHSTEAGDPLDQSVPAAGKHF